MTLTPDQKKIAESVCNEYGITLVRLFESKYTGKRHKKGRKDNDVVTTAKQTIAYLWKKYLNMSGGETSNILGYDSRSQSCRNVNTVDAVLSVDKAYQEQMDRIIKCLPDTITGDSNIYALLVKIEKTMDPDLLKKLDSKIRGQQKRIRILKNTKNRQIVIDFKS